MATPTNRRHERQPRRSEWKDGHGRQEMLQQWYHPWHHKKTSMARVRHNLNIVRISDFQQKVVGFSMICLENQIHKSISDHYKVSFETLALGVGSFWHTLGDKCGASYTAQFDIEKIATNRAQITPNLTAHRVVIDLCQSRQVQSANWTSGCHLSRPNDRMSSGFPSEFKCKEMWSFF